MYVFREPSSDIQTFTRRAVAGWTASIGRVSARNGPESRWCPRGIRFATVNTTTVLQNKRAVEHRTFGARSGDYQPRHPAPPFIDHFRCFAKSRNRPFRRRLREKAAENIRTFGRALRIFGQPLRPSVHCTSRIPKVGHRRRSRSTRGLRSPLAAGDGRFNAHPFGAGDATGSPCRGRGHALLLGGSRLLPLAPGRAS